LAYAYIGCRLIIPMGIKLPWKTGLWVILILFMPMSTSYLILRRQGAGALWCDVLAWVAYLSLGFFCLVFTFLVIRDLALLVVCVAKKGLDLIQHIVTPGTGLDKPPAPERRSFLIYTTNLSILGVSGAIAGYGFCNTRYRPNIVRVSVPILNLPADLEGFRIVQITDIHISPTIKKSYVENIVEQVNDLKPNIIAFTGDLADGPVSIFRNDAAPLKDLSADYGSYFVTGNHEYYAGAEAWIEETSRLGLTVLLNEHRIIRHNTGRILLAGVTDYNAGRFFSGHVSDPNKAISGAPESNVKILLAHQPRSIFSSGKVGFDLQISGHTHGGQFFPWQFLVGLQQPYLAGLHQYNKTWIYVSRGTGYWGPPIRLGAPAEITEIMLTKKHQAKNTA